MAFELVRLVFEIIWWLVSAWAMFRVWGLTVGWWGWDNEKKDWTNG